MDYALQLLIPLLLGIYAGQWLDTRTGHSPWFTLAGLLLGMGVGFAVLYKRVTSGPGKPKPPAPKSDKQDPKV